MDKEATKESTLYFRIFLLFINVATKIVRSVFKHYAVQTIKAASETSEDAHQTSEKVLQSNEDARQTVKDAHETNKYVKAFLSSHETRRQLDELHRKNILLDKQYNMVTIENPSVEDFDISLLIILLCSLFKKNIKPPEKGWRDKKPAPTDLTLGADLIRLRNYRNKIVGHSVRARIFDHVFNDYWKDLETIFIRICKKICPSEKSNIEEEVQTYRTMNIDQQTEKRCRVAIQDLRENCKDIVELQEQVEKLISKTNEFSKFFKERPERYSRYIRLLFEGGQLVLSALLQRECSRSEKSIKVLIQNNTEAIRENLGVEVNLHSLSETDPEKWDILHIATILLLLFKDTLKSTEIERIKVLLGARLDYSKIAVESLDETSFNKRYSELEKSLLVLSLDLGEKRQNECVKCIDDNSVVNERADGDIHVLEEYFGRLEKHCLNIQKLSDVYKDTLNQLKDAMKKMEDEDIGFKTEAVIQLKMITHGTEEQKRKLAEQTVETVWRAALDGAENLDRFDDVRQVVEEILGEIRKCDIRAADIETKCIVMSLICPSPRSVSELLEYIESTHFQELCFLMSYELCDIYDDTIAVSANITIESLYLVLKNTLGDRDDASTSEDLTFPLASSSVEGIRRILAFVKATSTISILSTFGEKLSEQVDDDISVKLRVDLQCLSVIFSQPEETCSGVLMEQYGASDVSVKPLPIDPRQLSSEDRGKRKGFGEVGGIDSSVVGPSLQTAPVQPSTFEAEVLSGEKNDGCCNDETHDDTNTRLVRLQREFLDKANKETLDEIQGLADNICSPIRDKYKNADYIWLAYQENKMCPYGIQIFLMIEIQEDCSLSIADFNDQTLEVCVYKIGEIINEEEEILYQRDIAEELSYQDLIKMRDSINKYADDLLASHKHLTIIEPSGIRFKDSKYIKEKCISLYVRKKGFIPAGETSFKTTIEEFPVDVREGIVYQAMQNEFTETLKMGCKIVSSKYAQMENPIFGTLGGFVDHPEYGVCGMTAAHVLLNCMEMNVLMEKGEITWLQMPPSEVYFLDENNTKVTIGQFVKAVYEKGHDGYNGFEVAIFKIGRTLNTAGKFRDVANGVDEIQQFFNTGKVISPISCSEGSLFYKYGAATGKTTGKYIQRLPVTTVRLTANQSQPFSDTITLCNQMVFRGEEGRPFILKGDSGSLVMVPGNHGETECLGIVEGVEIVEGVAEHNNSRACISPIGPVLEKLNVSSFKCFQQDELLATVRALGRTTERLEHSHKQTKEGLEQGLRRTNKGLEQGLKHTKEGLEQGLKQTKEDLELRLEQTKDGLQQRLDLLEQTTQRILDVVERQNRQYCNVV